MITDKDKAIPEKFHTLFWDYDPNSIDIDAHSDFIIGRIMEIGTWDSMKWLRKTFSKDQLLSYLENRGKQTLPPRELNYWLFITGMSYQKRQKWLEDNSGPDHVWRTRSSH